MAEFPPNLVDGRRWIPSDILLLSDEVSSEEIAAGASNDRFPCTDDLARRLAALALIREQLRDAAYKPPPASPPPVYGPGAVAVQSAATRSHGFCLGPHQLERGLHAGHGNVPGYVAAASPVLHSSTLGKPVPHRAAENERLEALSQLPAGQQINIHGKLVGSQGSGIRFIGCFPRDRGGTGVFFPRVAATSTAAKANTGARKKKGPTHARTGQNAMVEDDAASRGGVAKQEEYCHSSHHRPTTDLGLPQEWTY